MAQILQSTHCERIGQLGQHSADAVGAWAACGRGEADDEQAARLAHQHLHSASESPFADQRVQHIV
jgi:hypothetical protein